MGTQEWKQLARPPKYDSAARCVVKLRVRDGGAHQGPSDLLGDLVRGTCMQLLGDQPCLLHHAPRLCVTPAVAATQERTSEFQVRWSERHGLCGGC
jgi:hypothetical protein